MQRGARSSESGSVSWSPTGPSLRRTKAQAGARRSSFRSQSMCESSTSIAEERAPEPAVDPGPRAPRHTAGQLELPIGAVSLGNALLGPGVPPVPRTVTQVVSFSVPTALGWYGWYKFCVEEELAERFAYLPWYRRLGGRWALGPFVLGILVPNLVVSAFPDTFPENFRLLSLLGAFWIYAVQYDLYLRVNLMAKGRSPLPPAHFHCRALFLEW